MDEKINIPPREELEREANEAATRLEWQATKSRLKRKSRLLAKGIREGYSFTGGCVGHGTGYRHFLLSDAAEIVEINRQMDMAASDPINDRHPLHPCPPETKTLEI